MANQGIARLQVERRGNRSVVVDQYSQAPLLLSKPLYLDGADFPTLFLRSPSSGLLADDLHEVVINVGDNARLELCTQGATLVYPGASSLHIRIELQGSGGLKFLPHPLILAKDAQLDQSIQVKMSKTSSLVLRESWVCGRIAMGEEWQFNRFDNLIEISEDDRLSYRECWSIAPDQEDLTSPMICGANKYFATLFDFADLHCADPPPNLETIQWSSKRGRGIVHREVRAF
jgi:urease accessory protein